MTSSWLFSRLVELVSTYLVQSTCFLVGTWVVMSAPSVWNRVRRGRKVADSFDRNPWLTERIWKLAAVLALMTAPLSLFTGWSQPVWTWSFAEKTTMTTASPTPQPIRDEQSVPHDSVGRILADQQGIQPDETTDLNVNTGFVTYVIDEFSEPLPRVMSPESDREIGSSDEVDRIRRSPSIPAKPATLEFTEVTPSSRNLSSSDICVVSPFFAGMHVLGIGLSAWFLWTLFRLAMKAAMLNRILAGCEPIEGALRGELDRLTPSRTSIRLLRASPVTTKGLGGHPVDLATEPFACGIFRWTMVFPEWIERDLSRAEWQALLAHEVAHLVRRDPWWLLIGEILCSCFAFQPLNFLARSRWQQSTELLCDDWAIEQDVLPTSLAHCLTRVFESRTQRRGAALGLTALGDSGSLTHRIHWLLRSGRSIEPKRHRGRWVVTLTSVFTGAVVGLYGPQLSFVHSADLPDIPTQAMIWKEIQEDMAETIQDLARIESQLSSNAEASALAKHLRAQAAALSKRLGLENLPRPGLAGRGPG